MRERALERDDNPNSPSKTSAEVFFVSGDPSPNPTMTTTINTDLLTPLGAYLRLRDAGTASFILESVERGRLGRNSWMGSGSRIVDFDEAAGLGLPIVGYLAYDHVATLEPTVQLPADGPDLPESRFVVADTSRTTADSRVATAAGEPSRSSMSWEVPTGPLIPRIG